MSTLCRGVSLAPTFAKAVRRLESPRCYWSTFSVGLVLFLFSIWHVHTQSSANQLGAGGDLVRFPGPPLPRACQGPCCAAPSSPGPTMPSVWWSTGLYNGTKVHLSSGHGTWWGPGHVATGAGLDWSSISCHHREALSAHQALLVLRVGPASVRFVTPAGKFVVASEAGALGAGEATPTPGTVFTVTQVAGSTDQVELRTAWGRYVTCTQEGALHADLDHSSEWERFKVREVTSIPRWRGVNLGSWLVVEDWMVPEVMKVPAGQRGGQGAADADTTFPASMRDEWKLAQALGAWQAKQRLERHYRTFVTHKEFRFLSQHGVNAVRIPVGWWLAQTGKSQSEGDFLRGHVAHLDRAFALAKRFQLGVLLVLHASPGVERSLVLEGQREWGVFPELVALMLEAVDWLAKRYSAHPRYLGITLLSENLVSGVPLDVLQKFYLDGYQTVRQHCPCAFVGISQHSRGAPGELRSFMDGDAFTNVLLELHEYPAFNPALAKKPFAHTVRFVEEDLRREILELQSAGRMVLVGEWSLALGGELQVSDEEMREYAEVQLGSYGKAEAGWFFWSLRMGRPWWPHWSFQEAVARGWLARKQDGSWD